MKSLIRSSILVAMYYSSMLFFNPTNLNNSTPKHFEVIKIEQYRVQDWVVKKYYHVVCGSLTYIVEDNLQDGFMPKDSSYDKAVTHNITPEIRSQINKAILDYLKLPRKKIA